MAKDLNKDDLVWAKMKGFPPWPARIAAPPDGKIPKAKKPQHYVFFFGTHDHAWIADSDIDPHSDLKLENARAYKKKSSAMQIGIQEIEEAYLKQPKKGKASVKDKKSVVDAPPKSGLPLVPQEDKPEEKAKKALKKRDTKLQNKKPSKDSSAETSSISDLLAVPEEAVLAEKPKKKPILKKKEVTNTEMRIPKNTAKKRPASDDDMTTSRIKDEDSDHDFRTLIANVPPKNKHLDNAAVIPSYEGMGLLNGAGCESSAATSSSILSQTSTKRFKGDLAPTDKKIGFLGLGAMGFEMVKLLLAKKHKVTIWNRSKRNEHESLIKAGASTAPTPASVVQQCDITVCCVLDSEAVKNVVYGRNGVLEGLDGHGSGKAYVEMSSIDPETSQELAEAISGRGGKYLEAPMVGQRQDIVIGAIVIIAAGDRGVFTECNSLWSAWSINTFYVGADPGYANKMSLIIKMMTGVSCAALSECMGLLQACGIQPDSFMKVMANSPCNFPLLLRMGNAIVEGDETVSIPVKHQQKDLAMAVSLGNTTQQPLTLAVAANDAFVRAAARDPDSDMTSIHQNAPGFVTLCRAC